MEPNKVGKEDPAGAEETELKISIQWKSSSSIKKTTKQQQLEKDTKKMAAVEHLAKILCR